MGQGAFGCRRCTTSFFHFESTNCLNGISKYLPVPVEKEIFPQVLPRDESACLPVNGVNGADRHLPVHWNNQYFFLPGVSFEWNARKLCMAALHRDHFKTESAGNTQDFS